MRPFSSPGRPRRQARRRRGMTLPMVAVCMVGVFSCLALGVDVGRMALARASCQGAADVAAMAGARSLNGNYPQDLTGATANSVSAAARFTILGQPLTAANLVVTHGTYRYDTAGQKFSAAYTLQTGENYNLTKVDISFSCPTTFARAFGVNSFNITSSATAAHRPRDVVIVLDYSGSMNNESDLWNNESYLDNGSGAPNNTNQTSNNSETVYPKFGHYSNEKNYSNYTNYANLLSPSADGSNPLTGNAAIGKSNVSIAALGIPALVNDFWQNGRGLGSSAAFTPVADTGLDPVTNQVAQPAGGDLYSFKNGSTTVYAATVADIIGSTTKNTGIEAGGSATNDYIQGPRYWGKTFFVWPPDPTKDWRQRYFGNGTFTGTAASPYDNTSLWDSSGNWLDPPGNYTINYKQILAWIKTSPNPFPTVLRSGNTLFYDQIPTDVPALSYDHTVSNSTITDQNQRFWKEYIDFTLGVWRDPNGNIQHPHSPSCSFGGDYTFGTPQISTPPGSGKFMDYKDNPTRPRHRMWFGPMTIVQYMSDTGLLPGTTHDISMYPMKTGLGGALQDIQANHPNDLVSIAIFNRPQYSNDAAGTGAFNLAQYSLTNNYQALINSLWLPPNSGTTDVRPWDANGQQTPRAHGDYDANTASSYGFMLAYNQLSSSPVLSALEQGASPGVGGLGRVGAQRLVIYETDGMANADSQPVVGFANLGAPNSYYHVLPGEGLNGYGFNQTALLQAVQNICNDASGMPVSATGYSPFTPNLGYPGFSTGSKPVSVQTIAFGAIFEVSSGVQTSSVSLLSQIAAVGGSVFPSSASDPNDGYRWCTGTITQRQTKLRQAFTNIMNSGIPISLIK